MKRHRYLRQSKTSLKHYRFGYKFHLIVDVKQAIGNLHPSQPPHEVTNKRIKTLSYDKAADSNIVYDEAGTVYCYDKVSDPAVRHKMSFIGFEPGRGTLKYRCPAAHDGFKCKSFDRCNQGRKYGLTKRVQSEIDFRRFCPLPRDTKKFEKLYKKRTAVERTNGRLKLILLQRYEPVDPAWQASGNSDCMRMDSCFNVSIAGGLWNGSTNSRIMPVLRR